MIDLQGHLAQVTGATGELGRLIATTLADPALHRRSERTSAAILSHEIRALGRRAEVLIVDVGEPTSIHKMRIAIAESMGAPSIVIIHAIEQIHA
ncbi:MAG TPA: hypothetical protein ENJ18_19415 [Nannocystis exedens]|nr:hypothetical protein [Nannocystis exedens]